MAMQVKRPAQNNAMSRAMGVAGLGLSIMGAPATGGTSLLAAPGSLQAMRGGSSPQMLDSKRSSINSPNRTDPMESLSSMADIASVGLKINDQMNNKPVAPDPAMKRAAESKTSSASDQEILQTFRDSEDIMNELRPKYPDLIKNIQMPIFKSIYEASRRFKAGQRINQGVA